MDRAFSRKLLGLPNDGILLGFGARNVNSTDYKGLNQMIGALEQLVDGVPARLQLAVLGTSELTRSPPFPTHCLGYLHDDYSLAAFYNAIDSMVVPSLEDNFPNVILECLACGTPVVAYATGGIPEMINEGETGFLAEKGNQSALSNGIRQCLSVSFDRHEISAWVSSNCSPSLVAAKHIDLYEELLSR